MLDLVVSSVLFSRQTLRHVQGWQKLGLLASRMCAFRLCLCEGNFCTVQAGLLLPVEAHICCLLSNLVRGASFREYFVMDGLTSTATTTVTREYFVMDGQLFCKARLSYFVMDGQTTFVCTS